MMDSKRKLDGELENVKCDQKRIQDILKPLLFSMKLFGVYHDVYDVTSVSPLTEVNGQRNTDRKSHGWVILSRFYSVFILILMWADLTRCGVVIPPYDSDLPGRIVIFVWLGLVAIGDLVMFITCEKSTYLNAFYKQWNEIYLDPGCYDLDHRAKGLSRAAVIGTVAGWLWAIFNTIAVLYLQFVADKSFAETVIRPFPSSIAVDIILVSVHLVAIGVYVFPIIFILVTCYIMKASFDQLTLVLEKQIRTAGKSIPTNFDRLRRVHLQMCRAVSVLDRSVRLLVAVEYAINIPLACFMVYQLVYAKVQLITVIVNLFWLSVNIISIVAVTLSCALVHDAALAPLEHIFEIRHTNITPDQSLEVTLFISQLTGTSVGFTVLGMLVLTKEVLLTLAGLYITYFFLLLQFRI